MTFRSGRTHERGIRVCVLENDTLYVSPGRYSMMQEAANGMYYMPGEGFARDADHAAFMALKLAGLLTSEIFTRRGRETKVVVDYDLAERAEG